MLVLEVKNRSDYGSHTLARDLTQLCRNYRPCDVVRELL